jgi:hypothetical protein
VRTKHALSGSGVGWAAAAIATVVACISVWAAAGTTWDELRAEYDVHAARSDESREFAPIEGAGFTGNLFVFFTSSIDGDDRFFLQAPRRPYGTLDLHDTLAALVRYFLLPAVQVTELDDATVVISYEADPARLGRQFFAQSRNGPQIYVSRLVNP